MKFKTEIENYKLEIQTIKNKNFIPYRDEEIPNKKLQKKILTKELAYYQLLIKIDEYQFYIDGLILPTDESEHQEDLEGYLEQEEILENLIDQVSNY